MIIIPARLNSSRYKNKVIEDVLGLPMVVRSALNARAVDDVVIAADDIAVLQIAQKHGIKAVMTGGHHICGTTRIYEAAQKLGLSDDEIIINVQADEPFIEVENLKKLQKLMREKSPFMGTLAKEIKEEAQIKDSNIVKVVLDNEGCALYFSRAVVPYDRDGMGATYLGHIGVYGYSVGSLGKYIKMQETRLENIEKLEQLRALYYGEKIAVEIVETSSIGIDTREDLKRAIEAFASRV